MRVFVTGATGFIGSAVVRELIDSGHHVLGLARSDAAQEWLIAAGAQAHRGSLDDLDSLSRGAATSDGVIHAAFVHDFSDYAGAGETDLRAVQTLGVALEGSNRPLVVTSVTTLLAPGKLGIEDDRPHQESPSAIRIASEESALAMADRGVRASAIRLPPSVHGDGDHGFVPSLIGVARTKGVSAYVGDGSNRWPAVHRLDAARLYRIALESAPPGSTLHAVADKGVLVRDIAAIIGERMSVPVVSKSLDEAADHFGWLSYFVSVDNPISSELTRKRFDWIPTQPGLLDDLNRQEYFNLITRDRTRR